MPVPLLKLDVAYRDKYVNHIIIFTIKTVRKII